MQYFSFQWHITDECDQRCKHCYIFSGEGCQELKSMTWKQMQEVVANCEDFCKVYNRKPYFYITGGDPILHPDFWKLMVLLKSKEIPFTIMGNPFHLDDEICRMLKVCGCEKYQMSLDGMEKTHDWFRKPGSFALTLEKVGCLNRAGIKGIIMSTVSKTNMHEIPENAKDGMIYGGCNCGNCHITISSNGDVMACRRVMNSKVANVFEDRLADVWICQMEQYRDYKKFEKCSKCELKAWCRGCPAVANGTTGSFYGADPQCWKTKNALTGETL